MSALGLTPVDMVKAVACVLVPPLVFTFTSSVLCFRLRFSLPRGAWLLAGVALVPALLSGLAAQTQAKLGLEARWHRLAAALFAAAFFFASLVGDLNYWYFSQPYFVLDSLRAYDEVNPAEVDGVRLMDAGKIKFAKGARLATDMAMSYTSWDVYCVAPITTSEGLPSQGSKLATYDLWAVGVNCCRSGETNFRCGQYDKIHARAALRQVSAEARPYFRLAVQQAEAAYNIEAKHPLFFYWVEDPVKEQYLFFTAAFGNWVLANGLHTAANTFAVICFVVMFNSAHKHADRARERALAP